MFGAALVEGFVEGEEGEKDGGAQGPVPYPVLTSTMLGTWRGQKMHTLSLSRAMWVY
jgi:hypothetical protein